MIYNVQIAVPIPGSKEHGACTILLDKETRETSGGPRRLAAQMLKELGKPATRIDTDENGAVTGSSYKRGRIVRVWQ